MKKRKKNFWIFGKKMQELIIKVIMLWKIMKKLIMKNKKNFIKKMVLITLILKIILKMNLNKFYYYYYIIFYIKINFIK